MTRGLYPTRDKIHDPYISLSVQGELEGQLILYIIYTLFSHLHIKIYTFYDTTFISSYFPITTPYS